MEGLANAIWKHIAAGGPGVAWALVGYLLLRLHQLTDRQHNANLETIRALTIIKTLLLSKIGRAELDDNG